MIKQYYFLHLCVNWVADNSQALQLVSSVNWPDFAQLRGRGAASDVHAGTVAVQRLGLPARTLSRHRGGALGMVGRR